MASALIRACKASRRSVTVCRVCGISGWLVPPRYGFAAAQQNLGATNVAAQPSGSRRLREGGDERAYQEQERVRHLCRDVPLYTCGREVDCAARCDERRSLIRKQKV